MTPPRAARSALLRLAGLALALAVPGSVRAQRLPAPERAVVSVGFAAGTLSGLSVRLPARGRTSAVVVVGYDGHNDPTFQARAVRETDIDGSPLHGLVSAGGFVGRTGPRGRERFAAGALGTAGVGFYRGRFEVALEAVPSVRLTAPREAWVDAAFTLRYALF